MGQSNLKAVMLSQDINFDLAGHYQAGVIIETSPAMTGQSSPALILCAYRNLTAALQIVRVMDANSQVLLERVLWAGQALEFWAPATARLELFSGEWTNSLMVDSIVCERLQISTSTAVAA